MDGVWYDLELLVWDITEREETMQGMNQEKKKQKESSHPILSCSGMERNAGVYFSVSTHLRCFTNGQDGVERIR
jgi:hypothetical protein